MRYPIQLDLTGRLCVIVGGGRVALRKAGRLLAAQARVRVVAPCCCPELEALDDIEVCPESFRPEFLDGAFLVFAATDDAAVNRAVALVCRERGILINQAAGEGGGDFDLPALLRRGELMVSVSTDGGSPALAARVRDLIGERLGPEWGLVARIASRLRQKLLTVPEAGPYYQEVLSNLLEAGLADLVAEGNAEAIDQLLESLPAQASSLSRLGVHLPNGPS